MPNIAQVRRLINRDEAIGMGFNSASGLAVGSPLKDFKVSADPTAPGQRVFSSITTVNSHEELMDEIGMSFEAQGRYGFFQASAKAEFADSTNFNSTSTFIVAKCIVRNPFKRSTSFALTTPAQNLIDALRFDEFTTAFGDSFVRGLQTGGEFYTVIRITSFSVTKQRELALALEAEYNGLVGGGEFKGKFKEANSSASTASEFEATMYQQAGSGPTIAPITSIEELIPRFRDFPTIARDSAVAYETEVATYDTLPLPLPTPEEQENFVFALRDTREHKLRYIQTRNDLEFARRNPQFFEAVPPDDVLASTIGVYTKLINAVMDHADRLSRGEIKPPRTFDPSEMPTPLTEPAPIPLTRAKTASPSTIPVPDFRGLDLDDVDVTGRCLVVGSIDDCLAGTVFPDQDGQPSPIPIQNREVLDWLSPKRPAKLKFEVPPPSHDPEEGFVFVVRAQFPSAGSLVSADDEVILQFVEEEGLPG